MLNHIQRVAVFTLWWTIAMEVREMLTFMEWHWSVVWLASANCLCALSIGDMYKKINEQGGRLFTEEKVSLQNCWPFPNALVVVYGWHFHWSLVCINNRYWTGLSNCVWLWSMFMTGRFFIETSRLRCEVPGTCMHTLKWQHMHMPILHTPKHSLHDQPLLAHQHTVFWFLSNAVSHPGSHFCGLDSWRVCNEELHMSYKQGHLHSYM